MGGHTFVKDGLVLDMRGFNQVRLDKEYKILNVQTGPRGSSCSCSLIRTAWQSKRCSPSTFSRLAARSASTRTASRTNPGQVAPTVRSFRILLSDGEIKNCSLAENSELFHHALGGYGLMGGHSRCGPRRRGERDVRLENALPGLQGFRRLLSEKMSMAIPASASLTGAFRCPPRLSCAKRRSHTYEKTHTEVPVVPLKLPGYVWLDRLIINLSKTGDFRPPRSLDDGKVRRTPAAQLSFAERSNEPRRKAASFPAIRKCNDSMDYLETD